MKLMSILLFVMAISVPVSSFGADSQYCSEEYYKKISPLYENRNPETARIVFQILSCRGQISKDSKKAQFVALVGGYMRENPTLIEHLLDSANSSGNADAAKIYLDALWLCATEECRNKLRDRPFHLPTKDVTSLLAEPPPDPFSMPMADPATLDFLWGYFFGTGDIKIVERFFNLLNDNWEALNSEGTIGVNKRLVLSAARWSLVSIASQQELVKNVLEEEKSIVAQELLREVNKN